MSLDNRCERCQGYFRNFTQTVHRDGKVFCVQCDQAIKAGAPEAMYSGKLPANCILDDPEITGAAMAGMVLGNHMPPVPER